MFGCQQLKFFQQINNQTMTWNLSEFEILSLILIRQFPISLSPYQLVLSPHIMDTRQRCRLFLQMIGMFINVVISTVISFARPLYDKEDYHTSALSGATWILELLEGHPDQICCELGVNKHIFGYFISYLQLIGINHSRGITLEEQLAIFLYRCVTGTSLMQGLLSVLIYICYRFISTSYR